MRTTVRAVLAAMAITAGLAASATPAAAAPVEPREGYVATIEVLRGPPEPGEEVIPNEKFRVQLIERQDIKDAFEVLRSANFTKHINGEIVRTPSRYNPGYTWHLNPYNVAFYERSMEVCDGQPSFVTADWWNEPRFCPWHGKVVKMERVSR
ncbi:hypothetical protein [Actinoplanes teichomyceticus]|uniref:BP74 N-terminal domain-containing protein n=1 Tax=Actinoplanes teichomyceticus TaxID=1867 RepID=A0A561VMN7_ACTTI|nr:hypothetical protein [Actinoplanes teichomyceticus]TWG12884.1 hypothetical protein FHX34_105752 [Actinoplanes teichomyceticus]GIF13634.1 hypothetical protein Ate01nite_36660 [Actinoplanes teichomyceticus]